MPSNQDTNVFVIRSADEWPGTLDPFILYNVQYDFQPGGRGLYYFDGSAIQPLATQLWVAQSTGLESHWNWNDSQVMADPGAGNMRGNAAGIASVTEFAVSHTDIRGQNVSGLITLPAAGDEILVQNAERDSITLFQISAAPTNEGTWQRAPVTFLAGGSANPQNGNLMEFRWYPDR